MTEPQAQHESPAVSLVFGLIVVLGLMVMSGIGLAGAAWMGLVIGVIELVTAWRVEPPPGAKSVRLIVALMGAFLVVWSVFRLLVS